MQIAISQYHKGLQDEWDDFIQNNKRNSTFLHSRKFFKHNSLNNKDDASLLFYKKSKLIAVLPATIYNNDDVIIFHSHPRSTYGGFVTDETVGVEEGIQIVEATVNFAKTNKVKEIIIRNPFRIFHQLPSDEIDYAMWYHGFKIKSREIECTIKLSEHYSKRYDNGAKYNIKKARKSVTVEESNDFEMFWSLLTDNLLEKHNTAPVHTLQQFNSLRNLVGHDKIKLFGGFIENKLICGVVVFICKPMALHAQYIASDTNFQDIRPLNAVIDEIIDWGYKNAFSYFNLGTANDAAGRVINYGLFHFKEGFGGRGILRETMHLILD